jgi:excisionase family DNA binding protein
MRAKKKSVTPISVEAKPKARPILEFSSHTPPGAIDEPILTAQQVAERLQVKPSTIYEFTRKRQNGREPLKTLRAGKYLRFRWSDVLRWMEWKAA